MYTGIFINLGSHIRVRRIVAKIRLGDVNLLSFLKTYCTPRECASGLCMFLRQLEVPILPKRVQQLLIAENYGIPARIIARDALGLVFQELEGPHLELFIGLLDLMKILSTLGSLRPTEVRVSHAPFLLLPLFFSANDKSITKNWKNVANVLNEMIINFDSHLGPSGITTEEQTFLVQIIS